MKKYLILAILIFSPINHVISQQSETELKESFLAAESYFLFEEYNEALPLYLTLNRAYPSNSNYHFKIGVCYLNNPFEKEKSIYYLEKAITNMDPRYKTNSFKETSAPMEAMFYLGNAYRVNNQIKKARECYNKFLNQIDETVYDIQLVKDQLTACTVAENLMKKPVDFDIMILPEPINTRFSDMNPVLSDDETKMAYISKLQFYDAVFYTEKVDGKWTPPRNIIPELGVDGDVYPTCLSSDGKEMYFYRNDEYAGNIYFSRMVNGKWTPIVKLNENINTKYWESHACVSKDGKTLYFTSNRKEGYGELDIYFSKRQANGDWGPPKNLGPSINTKYNEDTPFITEDGKKIYFSSYGHYNMGGYDIFMSIRKNDTTWTKPVNIGYPINTTDDNTFFHPVLNGEAAYYSFYDEKGLGRYDIYRYVLYSPDNPRKFLITGQLDYPGENVKGSEVNIIVSDPAKGSIIVNTNPDNTGKFTLELPAGNYNMNVESEKFQKSSYNLIIPSTAPRTGITLPDPIRLKPRISALSPEEMDRLLQVTDTFITTRDNKPVRIKYNAERGSQVTIELYHESTPVSAEKIKIYQPDQSFTFRPKDGTNTVIFSLKDDKGNIVVKSVKVVKETPETLKKQEKTGTTVVPVKETVPEEQKTTLESYRQELILRSDTLLRDVLTKLDLEKEGIKTPEDLIRYLQSNAEKYGYPASDVDKLLQEYPADDFKDLDKLRMKLAGVSSGALAAYLTKMNLNELDIRSAEELTGHLRNNSTALGFRKEDVNTALLASAFPENLRGIITEMISNSTGRLQKAIKKLDPSREGIKSYDELILYLLDNSDKYGYNKEDVQQLVLKVSPYKSLKEFIEEMKSMARGNLKSVLDTLDPAKQRIYSINGLIHYLTGNSEQLGISEQEIWDILARISMAELNKPEKTSSLPVEPVKPEKNKLFCTIGAILLVALFILLLILMIRRKKRGSIK